MTDVSKDGVADLWKLYAYSVVATVADNANTYNSKSPEIISFKEKNLKTGRSYVRQWNTSSHFLSARNKSQYKEMTPARNPHFATFYYAEKKEQFYILSFISTALLAVYGACV